MVASFPTAKDLTLRHAKALRCAADAIQSKFRDPSAFIVPYSAKLPTTRLVDNARIQINNMRVTRQRGFRIAPDREINGPISSLRTTESMSGKSKI
jgi:hypothetical protein